MQIKSAKDLGEKKGTYLLYAAPGMGKTSTLRFLPGKTLVLDVDRTTGVLKGCENIDICEINTSQGAWESWQNTLLDLVNNYNGVYDNIAVDNISELERSLLSDLGMSGKNQGVPAQGDYQKMQFRLVNSLRYLKNMNARIILTAWEEIEMYTDANGQQYSMVSPQINKKIKANICGLCDVVGRLMVNQEGKRGYILEASNSVYAKNQLDDRKGCLQNEIIATVSG